jgi:hypothetical protein
MQVAERIHEAQTLLKRERTRGLGVLNEIFRLGTPPARPLNGGYSGKLVALDIAPGLTRFVEMISAWWMPWKGKTFDAARARGDNVFTRDSLALAHVYWPLYRGYVENGHGTYRAFAFRTRVALGLADPDRQVLKIDYDLDGNPGFSIRRVLDELVQVADGYYLGKAHVKWWWGRWQLVAYFTLSRNGDHHESG